MSKRFTDNQKYRRHFYRSLPPDVKLFYDFIIHECDHAGIWIVDFELASFLIGKKYKREEVLPYLQSKVYEFDGGKKWFIPAFIKWQYNNNLLLTSKVAASAKAILEEHGLYEIWEEYVRFDEFVNVSDIIQKKAPKTRTKKEPSKAANDIYEYYKDIIKPGASADAKKNIDKLLKNGCKEGDLIVTIDNYYSYLKEKQTETQYFAQANNFFGEKAYYVDFLADNFDLGKLIKQNGNVYLEDF